MGLTGQGQQGEEGTGKDDRGQTATQGLEVPSGSWCDLVTQKAGAQTAILWGGGAKGVGYPRQLSTKEEASSLQATEP